MRTILICPGNRNAVSFLTQFAPLVSLPLLGETVISYWIDYLRAKGKKEILVVAVDRPDQVRQAVGAGLVRGVDVEVVAALTELTAEEALLKYGAESGDPAADAVIFADHLPERPDIQLTTGYAAWFSGAKQWIDCVDKAARLGLHEIQPGVWGGLKTKIGRNVRFRPPCWIGNHVWIDAEAQIGPWAILENNVIVERAAEVAESLVGPETMIGALTRLSSSIAWGSTLINWKTGSAINVPDAFLMCSLANQHHPERGSSFFRFIGRMLNAYKTQAGAFPTKKQRLSP